MKIKILLVLRENKNMKILYIGTNVDKPPFEPLVDYQNDCLLIGLKELFGDDVVDASRRDHLYKDFPTSV